MKKIMFPVLIVLLFCIQNTNAQNVKSKFDSQWKKVNELAEKQLPESAMKEVESILNEAGKSNNFAEAVKAYIYKMRFTLDINPDEAPAIIKDFESFAGQYNRIEEKALLHSMTAELYAEYYVSNQYRINQRTEIQNYVPEDIDEWSKNIFFDTISKEITLSLENAAVLQKTGLSDFQSLLKEGKDNQEYQPTLYDFLALRGISVLENLNNIALVRNPLMNAGYFASVTEFIGFKPESQYSDSKENKIIHIYQELLSFRQRENNIPALLFVDAQRLDYVHENSESMDAGDWYISALESLMNKYARNDAVIDIIGKIAQYYLTQVYMNNDSEDNGYYRKMAYDITQQGIDRFPQYKRINVLKNIQAGIKQKTFEITYPDVVKPGTELILKLTSRNISDMQLSVYRVNATAMEYYTYSQNSYGDVMKPYPKRTLIGTKDFVIKPDENFGDVKNEFAIQAGTYGIYEFSLKVKGSKERDEESRGVFTVSDFAFFQRDDKPQETAMYVVDRITGQTMNAVNVKTFFSKWNGKTYQLEEIARGTTDAYGLFKYKKNRGSSGIYFLSKGNDQYFCSEGYSYYSRSYPIKDNPQLALFTDRSVYRPGQTVYFKGIAYLTQQQKVIEDTSYEVTLLDVNRQVVSKKTFKTNEFGSFSGEFVLPQGGLNGAYRLQSANFSTTFYVEDYKRPTFEVSIQKPEEEIQFGQKVTFTGDVKAYAGYNIPDAQVKYKVVRRTHRLFWWNNMADRIVASGIATTNTDGKFEVSFVPEKSREKNNLLRDQFYTYTITADVTDTRGETQQGVQTISVGDKSLFILSEVASTYDKQKEIVIPVHIETLNGKIINSIVNYAVYSLENQDVYREKITDFSQLKNQDLILKGEFDTGDKTLKLDLANLSSGYYRIEFTTKDAYGKKVESESVFVLYSLQDKRPPVKTYVWLNEINTEVSPGEIATISFGTSTNDASVLFEVMRGDSILESNWMLLSNEIKNIDIPFKAEYGDGFNVLFTFVKDEQLFSRSVQVSRKMPSKKLSPELSVFRDKLQPGEQEEWTVTIPQIAVDKRIAELMVDMYDASLDAIRPNQWFFDPSYRLYIPYTPFWSTTSFNERGGAGFSQLNNGKVPQISIDRLNWFGFSMPGSAYGGIMPLMRAHGVVSLEESKSMDRLDVREKSPNQMLSMLEEPEVAVDQAVMSGSHVEEKGMDIQDIQIRTNFNETAFFYPQLRTDRDGNVKFAFTAPESLTRWNVKMLAHTPDLYYGQGEAQVVTQKNLMVQLNMPRFVRKSDKLVLIANVINLTESTLTAKVNFQMFNPETEQAIKLKDHKIKSVILGANETKAVEWELTEFSNYELVTVRVTAQAGSFSDGEQYYLPVLPDEVILTESMPMTIRGNETRDFHFEGLIKDAKKVESKSLTIEFASNPTWYAIQALPTLSAPENENAVDYFTAYYVNGLATYIANSNPKLAATFDRWKQGGGNRETLLSNLEKNSELKNILLEETPWVLAARDESEQKRQLALLFDLNQQKNQGQQYLDKLVQLQLPSGGFAWFSGMEASRYITQQILLEMARYNKMTKSDVALPEWITKSIYYIDLQIAKDYDNLKKSSRDYKNIQVIGDMQWFYLHTRSEYTQIPLPDFVKEAVDFYTSQAYKYWTKATLYGKAATALIAFRNGNTSLANNILVSLKENAMKTDEMGMYWVGNTAGYFWNERPVSVQTAILDAFAEITNDTQDLDEMKIWLLKQKQTQRWDSPIATVDAIYALLNYGTDWLSSENYVEIKIGNKLLNPPSMEAGTGYFKETIEAGDIRPQMGNVTVKKTDAGIAWGAMYWQYFQDISQVQEQGGALSVTKKLFVERTEDNRTTMIPIEQVAVKRGDKIITRLVVITDRNLEFVALKDLRASCFEPVNQLSGMVWRDGVGYYETIKDASTQFFFNALPAGTYVFEYAMWANNSGDYADGMATIQCQYAPEFSAHSGGGRVVVR